MLLLFLIGAALSYARPETPHDSGLPTDPLRYVERHWRISAGVAAFWR